MNPLPLRRAGFFLAAFASVAALSAYPVARAFAADEPEYFPRKAAPGQNFPFSEAVRVGDMLYLSGEIGTDANGKLVPGGIRAEAKRAMDNIGASLARHGSSFERVVQCTVALAEIADWPAFNEVYEGYFTQHFPARMAYATGGLAMGAKVEVQCNAVATK